MAASCDDRDALSENGSASFISKRLSEALEEARDANDAKLNFFSKMSHDIRTPLNVVLGMTQIAKKYKHDAYKLDKALDNHDCQYTGKRPQELPGSGHGRLYFQADQYKGY